MDQKLGLVFNNSEQCLAELAYVSFDSHSELWEGIRHNSNSDSSSEIQLLETGAYQITYSVLTLEIAYFFLEWQGKYLSASDFFKGEHQGYRQDVGHVILRALTAPGTLRLRNISTCPVHLARVPKNAWIHVRRYLK